tara:strand:- start:1028 stop:1189 length:162 start_codon:yes stop_codon:yes gene_type:complete
MILKLALTGIITTGAFFTGVATAICFKDKKLIEKLKKMSIKKNTAASSSDKSD